MMGSIVVFSVLDENTRFMGKLIAGMIGGDVLEIDSQQSKGFDVSIYDTVVVGTCVTDEETDVSINRFLKDNDISQKNVALFVLGPEEKGAMCLDKMQKIAGAPCENRIVLKEEMQDTQMMMRAAEKFALEIIGHYDSDEVWDLYDAEGNIQDEKMKRGGVIPQGMYHKVISAWIKNSKGEFLMSRRSDKKRWCPGKWECTGGAVAAGETSIQAAVREVKEELGVCLDPKEGKLIRKVVSEELQDIYYVYIFKADIDIADIKKQDEEVADVQWMDAETIDELWQQDKLHMLLYYYKEVTENV